MIFAPLFLSIIATSISLIYNGTLTSDSFDEVSDPFRPFIWGTIYLLSTFIVVKNVNYSKYLLSVNRSYFLIPLLVLASCLWSSYPVKTLITFFHFFGLILICLATVKGVLCKGCKAFFKVIAVSTSIVIVMSFLTSILFPMRGIMLISGVQRWVGVTGHPNSLGLVSVISVWSHAVLMDYCSNKKDKCYCWFIIVIAFVCMFGADSKTSILLSVLVLIIIKYLKQHEKKIIGLAYCAVCLLILISIPFPELVGIDGFFSLLGRDSSFTGRTDIWDSGFIAIADSPILGWGFDGLIAYKDKYYMQYNQFHNGYLDLLVRGGVVAFGFFVLILISLFKRLNKVKNYDWQLYNGFLSLTVITILHNITESSILQFPNLLWLLFSVMFFCLSDLRLILVETNVRPDSTFF